MRTVLKLTSILTARCGAGISLPSDNLLFLFDPSVGVFADTALTIQVADGGAVRGLKDRGASALHLTQGGASSLLPIYRADVAEFNNHPALEFDGGDYLFRATAGTIIGNLTEYTVYVVFRTSNNNAERSLVSEGKSDNTTPYVAVNKLTTGRVRGYHFGDGAVASAPVGTGTIFASDLATLTYFRRRDATFYDVWANYHRENYEPYVVNNPGATTTDRLTIGGLLRTTFTQGFIGQIALVAAYSDDNHETVEPLIHAYFGMNASYYRGAQKTFVTIGDSKTGGWNVTARDRFGGFGYQYTLAANLTTDTGQTWRELLPRSAAHSGGTALSIKNGIDADLALVTGTPTPDFVLISIGTNDVGSLPLESAFKTNYGYIMDACHTKWAGATVLCNRVWRRTFDANCATINGWIADLVALRAWSGLGPDETVWLENGDDGATYTDDGIHPNAAGYLLNADVWQTAMGL